MTKVSKVLLTVAGLTVGVALTYQGYTDFRDSRRLAAGGMATMAKVVDYQEYVGRRGSRSYYLTVEFVTEGKATVSERVSVDGDVFDAAVASKSVKVHYLPNDPSVMQAGEEVKTRFGKLLIGLLISLIGLVGAFYFWATRKIASSLSILCETKHEYAPVDLKDFKHLDLSFYAYGRRELEALGYTFLEDTENLTARKVAKSPRTFLRRFLSADGTTMATLYRCTLPWLARKLGAKETNIIDLDTAFSNSKFVNTSNAEAAGKLDHAPELDGLYLADSTPLPLVVRAHEQHVAKFKASHPGAEPLKLNGVEDFRRMQAEMLRINGEYRQKTGVTKQELQRIGGVEDDKALTELYADVTKEQDRKNRKAA